MQFFLTDALNRDISPFFSFFLSFFKTLGFLTWASVWGVCLGGAGTESRGVSK